MRYSGLINSGQSCVAQTRILVPRSEHDRFVEALDDQLARHEWIAGDALSFADITALVTVDFAAKPAGLAIPEGAGNLMRWYKAMSERPSAAA